MALCAISGQVPEEPVVSKKSGHVFEKRLIEKHFSIVGHKCPITSDELNPEDLIPLQINKTVKPRPPAATSIPGMIQIFQNEWDTLMLETYTLKQHLETVRQELAHSLYQQDAACRVIARLIKERDQARSMLGDTTTNMAAAVQQAQSGGPITSAGARDDGGGINEAVGNKMQEVAKALSKNRKKKVKDLIAQVAATTAISSYTAKSSLTPHSAGKPGIVAVDIHPDQNLIVTAGVDGNVSIANRNSGKVLESLKGHKKKVTDVKFHPTEKVILSTSADGTAIVWSGSSGAYTATYTLKDHKGEVSGLSIHPSGSYVVTASLDRTWAFYDLGTGKCRQVVSDEKVQGGYTRVQFHPDGLILGTGTADSFVRIFDVKAQKNVATFKGHVGAVSGLSFSENGFYLASGDDNGTVKLWDLRKLECLQTITDKSIKAVHNLEFDPSGTFLAVASADIKLLAANGKAWEVVHTFAEHTADVTAVKFGRDASFFVSTSMDRSLKVWA
jgi:pre-mRNA-processing factor 19